MYDVSLVSLANYVVVYGRGRAMSVFPFEILLFVCVFGFYVRLKWHLYSVARFAIRFSGSDMFFFASSVLHTGIEHQAPSNNSVLARECVWVSVCVFDVTELQ